MACFRLTPTVRRVRACPRLVNRASACGAIRRRGSASPVKLKPRNLRAGRATALFALLTFSLRCLVRKRSTLAMTLLSLSKGPRPRALHVDVAVVSPRVRALRGPRTGSTDKAMAAPLQFPVQHVPHQVRQQRREGAALRRPLVVGPN